MSGAQGGQTRGPLAGRTVMLTGAGGALATVVADALREAGATLVLVARGGHGLTAREGETIVEADLATHEGAASLAAYRADALVHTAGGFAMRKVHEATPEDLRAMFSANVDTLFHATRAVLPTMRAAGRGVIVGIGAGQAARGAGAGAALYTAAKSAVHAFLKSLDAEGREAGVRATVLVPMGAIDTPANRESGMKPEAMIDPRDLADAVVFVLTRSPRGHVDELRVNPR
ncbi:SDR family oxidoreductase [Deinococcus pimensis]|uniref:SDR family oxidoreductase n=1 Tax=Deinococcus pimensis TaxID=309888 RepID=UPI0004B5D296|nr:SDR family NAD(P)-dependent oxidoreductase [Deinococcus pimensis]